ncbi:MAG: hypothetical protein ABF652_09600 [Clostridium beijerinckii]
MFLSLIICSFSILIFITSKYILDITFDKAINILRIINEAYLEFWRVKNRVKKIYIKSMYH